ACRSARRLPPLASPCALGPADAHGVGAGEQHLDLGGIGHDLDQAVRGIITNLATEELRDALDDVPARGGGGDAPGGQGMCAVAMPSDIVQASGELHVTAGCLADAVPALRKAREGA